MQQKIRNFALQHSRWWFGLLIHTETSDNVFLGRLFIQEEGRPRGQELERERQKQAPRTSEDWKREARASSIRNPKCHQASGLPFPFVHRLFFHNNMLIAGYFSNNVERIMLSLYLCYGELVFMFELLFELAVKGFSFLLLCPTLFFYFFLSLYWSTLKQMTQNSESLLLGVWLLGVVSLLLLIAQW